MSSHESSPSTGARGTAAAMDATYGLGRVEKMEVTDGEKTVKKDVLPPDYRKDFFGVSS